MSELWAAYWPVILVAVAIGLITGILIFRPKQRVTLNREEAPVRPHMTAAAAATAPPIEQSHELPARSDHDGGGEGEGVVDEVAAATSDVIGEVLGTHVHANLPGSQGVPDDLQRMKGVGPKLAALLNSRGLVRYEQIAALSSDELEQLDAELGAFKGRLARDRVVEQAGYLARDDQAGYEAAFGKL
jgi:predicted flap endonuclease-1-like 5' DNA nuclease